MPQLPIPPLTELDLAAFLATNSDFGFEMATLRVVRSLGLLAEHAAVYTDPVTNKLRAYDIRARGDYGVRQFRFAIESKNLNPASPLLVRATPRLESEAYHTVVARYWVGGMASYSALKRSNVYQAGRPVGRQTDQPSRSDKGDFRSSDSATYDKWLQAVNGCVDLPRELTKSPLPRADGQAWAIVPFLVVPEGTVWQVEYDAGGAVSAVVHLVDETTLILRHPWTTHTGYGEVSYDISHLEIVTLPRLHRRLKNLIEAGGLLSDAEEFVEQAAR